MAKRHNEPYRLFKRGEIYHAYISFISETGERIQLRETTGRNTEQGAISYCLKRIAEINKKEHYKSIGELEPITIDEAFGRYFQEKGRFLSLPKQRFARLKKLKSELPVSYLHEIQEPQITSFINNNRHSLTNSTINRYLFLLSAVITTARDEWKVKTYPLKISKFKLTEPAENIKYLKDWEVAQRIIDQASPHLKPIIYTALYTGLRLGNLLNLKWSELDFNNDLITLKVKDKTKEGGKILSLPVIPQLKEILLQQPKINDFVFNYQGKPIKSITRTWHSVFYKWQPTKKPTAQDVIETRKKDGKTVIYKRVLKDPTLPYVNFHTLRHTAATWILKKTNNLRITKEILGHSNINTTMKYAHVLDDEKRKALNSVFD